MRYLTTCCDEVTCNIGTIARVGFFTLELAALSFTEMGLTRQLSAEVMCDFAMGEKGEVCDGTLHAIEYTTYVVWVICVPLFVMSRCRSSWEVTDLSRFSDRIISMHDFCDLTTFQKAKFIGFVSILLVAHYAMAALTKYMGVYYMLRATLSLSKLTTEMIAGLMTFVLATVSFGFSVPDCLRSAMSLVTQSNFPHSIVAAAALFFLGLGVSGASVDYLMRFLATKNQVVLHFIPVLIMTGVVEFLYPMLTSGSILKLLPQIKRSIHKHYGFAGLLSVSAVCWWPMNAHQLAGGVLQLAYSSNSTEPASTGISDICQAVADDRHGSTLVRVWVFIVAAVITLVSTTFFELYQFSKTLNIKTVESDTELAPLLITNGHRNEVAVNGQSSQRHLNGAASLALEV